MKKILLAVVFACVLAAFARADAVTDAIGMSLNTQVPAGAGKIMGNLSMWGLLWGLVFSSVGLGAFLYGKKKSNAPFIVIGILLMVYPYVVQQTYLIVLTGAVLSAGLYFFRRS